MLIEDKYLIPLRSVVNDPSRGEHNYTFEYKEQLLNLSVHKEVIEKYGIEGLLYIFNYHMLEHKHNILDVQRSFSINDISDDLRPTKDYNFNYPLSNHRFEGVYYPVLIYALTVGPKLTKFVLERLGLTAFKPFKYDYSKEHPKIIFQCGDVISVETALNRAILYLVASGAELTETIINSIFSAFVMGFEMENKELALTLAMLKYRKDNRFLPRLEAWNTNTSVTEDSDKYLQDIYFYKKLAAQYL